MFGHHAPPGPLAELMIYGMCLYGVIVCAFGVGCLVYGIKRWFK